MQSQINLTDESKELDEQTFDEQCIAFWRGELEGSRLNRETDRVVQLATLGPGSTILDLGAGTGRISITLADRGMRPLAIERSEHAYAEAAKRKHANYKVTRADWIDRPWRGEFDCVLFWFTTLCAGFEKDLEALRIAHSALSKHGKLLIETRHWDRMNRQFQPLSERRYGNGLLIEQHSYDPTTGVQTTIETYHLEQETRRRRYQIRRYTFAEMRQMCFQAGFINVQGFDENGFELSNNSERAILRATII